MEKKELLIAIVGTAICLVVVAGFIALVIAGNHLGAAVVLMVSAYAGAVALIIEYELRD